VSADGAGFGRDYSSAAIVSGRAAIELGFVEKRVVATMLVDAIADLLGMDGDAQDQDHQEGANG